MRVQKRHCKTIRPPNPRRILRLSVGISPSAFESFVETAQNFGKLTELTINKTDKTNEYRDLQAKRVSLEKTRTALNDLKSRDGDIQAMIALEQQILSLEQQIQALGVSLGDFDTENEFVTVKLLLAEIQPAAIRNVSTTRRMFTALVWTLTYYLLLWIGIAACLVATLVAAQLTRLASRLLATDSKVGQI